MPTDYAGDPANYPTEIELPSDGDARSAASVSAPLEALADRTAWLARRRVKLVDRIAFDDEVGTLNTFTATFWDGFTNGWIDVPNAEPDDVILVDLSFMSVLGSTATDGSVRLAVHDAWTGVETLGPITGARVQLFSYVISGTPLTLVNASHLAASHVVQDAGTVRIAIQGKIAGPPGLGTTLSIVNALSMRVVHLGGIG